MTSLQAKAAIAMFDTRLFDTAEIAAVLHVHESVVVRTLNAARGVVHELYRAHVAALAGKAAP